MKTLEAFEDSVNRLSLKEIGSLKIMVLDVSNLTEVTESLALLTKCEKWILSQPFKSVCLLSNVTNTRYNKEAINRMQAFSKTITPYMKASAIVGVGKGVARILLNGLLKLSGREIKTFETVEEAEAYLVTFA